MRSPTLLITHITWCLWPGCSGPRSWTERSAASRCSPAPWHDRSSSHTRRTSSGTGPASAGCPLSVDYCSCRTHTHTHTHTLGVTQTNRLVDFSALHDALSLMSSSRWSYRGRYRILNPHLRSVSKQLKLQTNSYSESAPQTCVIILLDAGNWTAECMF